MDTSETKEKDNNILSSQAIINAASIGATTTNLHELSDQQCETTMNHSNNKKVVDDDNGRIVSWGCGEFGQHGRGDTRNVSADESLMCDFYERIATRAGTAEISSGLAMKGLKSFSCGASHTVVVTDTDEIYTWGNGNSGQLGCGDKETHLNPQKVRLPSEGKASPIMGVACGGRHTTVWLENGQCFSWGNNFYAQLGYDFRIENYKDNQVFPHVLRPIAHVQVKQVACGEKHTLFLYDTGVVAACGCNSFGQLGSGGRAELVSPKTLESLEGVVYIACGANHSLAVTGTGELFAWGLGRACGHRREDVLQPVRQMTRQCNVVVTAGGSAHSVALTANGTVYTWGGGTEGQLGQGSSVMYLSEPKSVSHDALPRISQIACGDSYTAAITGDGALYMWGKSSHVIPTPGTANPSSKHPTPERVSPAGQRVAQIACGSWHVMAITGIPEWQPLEEDSGEEVDDDSDSSDNMDAASESKNIHQEDMLTDTSSVFHQPTFENSLYQKTESMDHVQREGTKLTLAEFYAPTPLPIVSPLEEDEYCHEMYSDHEELAEKKRSRVEAVLNPEGTVQTGVVSQEEETTVEELECTESEETTAKQDSTSFFVDIVPVVEKTSKKSKPKRERLKQVKEVGSSESSQYQSRRSEPFMVRSKTMPVANRKPLKVAPTSTTTAFDWSVPPQHSMEAETVRDRFVIHKHVSVQMNRKNSSGSGDGVRGKKPIAQVGFHSSRGVDERLTQTKDKNVMPQPTKYNRAKTFYGRTNHRKKQEVEPQMSRFLSALPPAPSQPSLAPTMVHTRRQAALGKLPGPSDRSPVRTKPSLDRAPAISELPSRAGLSGQPLFSSATSWRMRNKDNSLL